MTGPNPATAEAVSETTRRLVVELDGVLDAERVTAIVASSAEILAARPGTADRVGTSLEAFSRDRVRAVVRAEVGDGNPSVLFLCVHNSGRSQMAAGWLRHLGGDRVDVYSGGSEPGAGVNPAAVAAMAEVGVDITSHLPQPWTDEILRAVDVVVTMGCGDTCPIVPGTRYEDWELADPKGQPIEMVREVRDDIRARVEQLLAGLSPGDPA